MRKIPVSRTEKVLYRENSPLQVGVDVCAIVSLYFFWEHRPWPGLLLHVLPLVIASALVILVAGLEPQTNSTFGKYVRQMMTGRIEALRLSG